MEKAFSWLSACYDQYDTPNMHKHCFQTQLSFHDRETIHNLSVRKENYRTNIVFGLFSAAYNWEMLANCIDYRENLRSNVAELGQIWDISRMISLTAGIKRKDFSPCVCNGKVHTGR